MYVVFAEELEEVADIRPHTVASLEQASPRSSAAAAISTISSLAARPAGHWF